MLAGKTPEEKEKEADNVKKDLLDAVLKAIQPTLDKLSEKSVQPKDPKMPDGPKKSVKPQKLPQKVQKVNTFSP